MPIVIQLKLSHVRHITLLLSLLAFFSLCRSSTDLDYLNPAMTQVGCIEHEREALMHMKAAFSDPYGQLSSWTGQHCCSNWTGVTCSNITGHVEELDLSHASLSGYLSSSISDLKYLTYLNLAHNSFENKAVSESFSGSMERLTYLNISCSLFGGIIPPQLGNLSNLVELYISCDGLRHISSELSWLSSLSSLQHLQISSANLSLASEQWLQSVNMLSKLKSLEIVDCELAYLPQTLPFLNLTSLTHLDLSYNKFNSSVPTWFSNASSLEAIDIRHSGLVGRIPRLAFQNMCSLQSISLSDNLLEGGLAELIDALAECSNSSIQELDLSSNQLLDYLPDSLGRLRNLNNIDLCYNSLFGSIPASIGNLANLQSINLIDNLMNGTIPESIGQLEGLRYLCISFNNWHGVISDAHLSSLVNLTLLSLSSSNQSLIFDISADWKSPFNLSRLNIRDCKLGASFPSWIAGQTNLSGLDLGKTALSGAVPDSVWKMSKQFEYLDLSENQLQGNLPEMLTLIKTSPNEFGIIDLGGNLFEGRLPRLSNINMLSLKNNKLSGVMPSDLLGPLLFSIDLSGNMLVGNIPKKWDGMDQLTYIDFSENMLVGNIPKKWDGMDRLGYIDFSGNNLSDEVPEELCRLPSLIYLKLSKNNLSGDHCSSVPKFASLRSIDLGENGFSGNVPKWRGDSLEEIRLHGNLFKGSLPTELCSLPSLHVLDISHNKLSGPIPPCFGKMIGFSDSRRQWTSSGFGMELIMKGNMLIFLKNLRLLHFIDLSANELSGKIPEQITNLSRLISLNLSENQISGHIPENIGLLKKLESLDLSNNDLEGHIPASLASITLLTYLNLSHNNLSGPIPTNNQFQTFNDPSIYEANPGLCGTPLPKMCDAHNPDERRDKDHLDNSGVSEKMMLVISIVLGFIFGFWSVCGTLAIKRSWRDACFRFLGI